MDILISSNLERLIYRLTGNDADKCAQFMKELGEGGEYTIAEEMKAQLGDFMEITAASARPKKPSAQPGMEAAMSLIRTQRLRQGFIRNICGIPRTPRLR